MVKGISRQVIVVQSPDQKLFEQAIFILRENAPAVTEETLLKEAKRAVNDPMGEVHRKGLSALWGPAWAFGGALLTGLVWLLTAVF